LTEQGGYVKRAETRERLGAYLRGLLGEVERGNSWQLAEHQGDAHPYGFQHLNNRAQWNIECCVQGSKSQLGLNQYEVRNLVRLVSPDHTGNGGLFPAARRPITITTQA
tara:strand:- start:1133 stop:1459 length:327 start_codon:yes stop_codon:yes gene_type:complete